MPASTAAPPFTAAGEEDPFALFFLQPLFLHGFGAATHLLVALAIAGHLVSRRCGPSSSSTGRRAKDGRGAFRCYGVAACVTWAMAAAEVLSAAYSCYFYLGGGGGWSRDAVAALADAAARARRRGCCSPRTCSSSSGGGGGGERRSGSPRRSGSGGPSSCCSPSSPSPLTWPPASTGSPCPR
ncbi:hypothetical protein PR202_gb26275 [Eleusine coracana subsp. coracana]|uniref:Uncharacterized protein n=1 Tax=Eleusine coracana subsp. coracana TaxID=191504 RepID=A0AAV5FS97_ELECO|nr:hypothetical protein PR202_gb26275 [Eleusine coracana subsp. coracana]